MKIRGLFAVIMLFVTFGFVGCENYVARNFGGSMRKTLPAGQKLVNLTWKDADLWILTRPMREGEKPETYVFSESSNLGIMEGSITVVEQASKAMAKPTPTPTPTPFINATVSAK